MSQHIRPFPQEDPSGSWPSLAKSAANKKFLPDATAQFSAADIVYAQTSKHSRSNSRKRAALIPAGLRNGILWGTISGGLIVLLWQDWYIGVLLCIMNLFLLWLIGPWLAVRISAVALYLSCAGLVLTQIVFLPWVSLFFVLCVVVGLFLFWLIGPWLAIRISAAALYLICAKLTLTQITFLPWVALIFVLCVIVGTGYQYIKR